jgi:hypothetical protein
MDKLIIQIISIISKSVNSLAIHCQVVTQCTKHQLQTKDSLWSIHKDPSPAVADLQSVSDKLLLSFMLLAHVSKGISY